MNRSVPTPAAERLRYFIEANQHTPEYELEWLLLDIHEAVWAAMQARGVSRAELAERLGTSRAYITKLLEGQENMTVKTLVRVANALEMKVGMKLVPRERAPGRAKGGRAVTAPKVRTTGSRRGPGKRVAAAARARR